MQKFTIALALIGLTAAANAAPSYLVRDGWGGYNVTYDYTDKPKNDWYMAIRAELSLMNWTNEYNSNNPDYLTFSAEDDYSFEPVFGGSLAIGTKFGSHWRGDIEIGYLGEFTDKDNDAEFTFAVPYAMVNAMYDFIPSGIYLGAGLGVAVPMITVDHPDFVPGGREKTGVSPMAGLMVGWSRKLDDNFILDVRYRLAGFYGTKLTRDVDDGQGTWYETKIGLVLDNSLSVGIRYEF